MCFDRLQLSEQIRQDGHDETGFLNLQHPVHLVHPVKNPFSEISRDAVLGNAHIEFEVPLLAPDDFESAF
jgi:hypothetical protein